MLLYTMFALLTIGFAVGAALEGGAAFARTAARHAAERIAMTATQQARSALLASVAAQIARGGTASAITAPDAVPSAPACPVQGETQCPFSVTATFALRGATTDAGSASNENAASLQTHSIVGEGRVAFEIDTTVTSRTSAIVATKRTLVTLRTFGSPPYVAVDGVLEGGGARSVATSGDIGGCDGAHGNGCDAAASTALDDTRIRVVERCDDGGNGACSASGSGARAVDRFADHSWYDANAGSHVSTQ